MKTLDIISGVLLVIGGLSWGLVGIFNFDFIAAIFGPMSILSRIAYVLISAAALYEIITVKGLQARWAVAKA